MIGGKVASITIDIAIRPHLDPLGDGAMKVWMPLAEQYRMYRVEITVVDEILEDEWI